jgi:hypothetical protein
MEIRSSLSCSCPRSLSAVELEGGNLVRQIYADESGVSPNEDIVLVAGININADKQWDEVSQSIYRLTEEYIPEEFRWKKGFHAKDMFNGHGIFGGQYPRKRAFEALKALVELIPKFGIPVSWGCALKPKKLGGLKPARFNKLYHAYAFAMFVAESECTMAAFQGERAQIFTESHPTHFSELKRAHKILQGKFGAVRDFFPELSPDVLMHLPTRRIIDCVAEQAKDDAVLLQLSDACAFLLHRWASGKTDWHTQEIFDTWFVGHSNLMKVFTPLPPGQTFRHGTFIFNAPACETTAKVGESMLPMDASQEALRQVEEITGSEPVKGEDLVQSDELKRKFREAKDRLKSDSDLTEPDRE